jgi:sugar/nucleoside kinase (ribokinase family)
MNMDHLDVFCYGELGVDNIIQTDQLPTPEIAVFPREESYHIGGAAANTAVWLATMGVPVGLAGNFIGNDQYGRWLLGWLKKHTLLDLSLVEKRNEIPTPYTRAIVTPDGERSFLIFYYSQTPKLPFQPFMLRGAKYVALDLYGGPERLDAARDAIRAGAQTTIGDVIWADHEVLPHTSIATNSASYIRSAFPGIDVRQHARKLQSINKGIIITTDGAEDVFVLDKKGAAFTVRPPRVTSVDSTGAGDAFRAGLLYGLLKGLDLPRSVCLGVATGALKVGFIGAATTLPKLNEIETLSSTLAVKVSN